MKMKGKRKILKYDQRKMCYDKYNEKEQEEI